MKGFLFALGFLLLNFTICLASSCPFSNGDHAHHHHDHHSDAAEDEIDDRSKIAEEHVHCHHDHHYHPYHRSHEGPPVHGRQLPGDDHDDLHHQRSHNHRHSSDHEYQSHKIAEEISEEEELQLYGFKSHAHRESKRFVDDDEMSLLGLWAQALGCSLLVSMASLICLILLPLIIAQGKPSRIIVDSLAAFGAGAMLGDAFLHQLPHALGSSGGHAHSHSEEYGHVHDHQGHTHPNNFGNFDWATHSAAGGHGHGHAHSMQDLSVGLAVLAGIVVFFIVEKIVRQLEKSSSNGLVPWVHHHRGHHHHGHHHHDKQHPENGAKETDPSLQESSPEKETVDRDNFQDYQLIEKNTNITNGPFEGEETNPRKSTIRKRVKKGVAKEDEATSEKDVSDEKADFSGNKQSLGSNLILGYLNLFSDGVHNFTDGMALGSAFLTRGAIGGWSSTLFLLAHELPQEVGDFGILVQSGFTVTKALAFNFLSALVALAGTAVALLMGGSPGHSSFIEGFTAGGFIYIAVAGVLPEMHQHGSSPRITMLQLFSLGLGMSSALLISLAE